METIKKFIELNDKNRISVAVVGDALIDQYFTVQADRVSPEFPIPIMLSDNLKPTYALPGGAANVAYQLKNFNTGCLLFSFLDKLSKDTFRSNGVNTRSGTSYAIGKGLENRVKQVPIKMRLYQGDFPLCRWDIETENYGTKAEKLNEIHKCLHQEFCTIKPQISILSDYNKGFFTEYSRKLWLESSAISIVDPKKGPASNWKGCTIFKLNSKEARELSGCDGSQEQQCDILLRQTEAELVVITNGGDGVFARNSKSFEYKPRKSVIANSVIGAGDCFAAIFALAYAHKMEIEECIEVAFEAGSVYVQNKHNKPITPYDLLKHQDPLAAKLVDPAFLANRDFSLCFTNGCFDILHDSHINLLRYAKSTADKLVVAVDTDERVRDLKGPNRPINNLESRMRMLSMFEFVDYVVPFKNLLPLIQRINPDILCKGGDYKKEDVVGNTLVDDVRIFPYEEGNSTSCLIKKIKGDTCKF